MQTFVHVCEQVHSNSVGLHVDGFLAAGIDAFVGLLLVAVMRRAPPSPF